MESCPRRRKLAKYSFKGSANTLLPLTKLPSPHRFASGTCTEGSSCKFAHGHAELQEWEERRAALKMKLNKARKDHLIAPNDNDFGKYSFLFKDLN